LHYKQQVSFDQRQETSRALADHGWTLDHHELNPSNLTECLARKDTLHCSLGLATNKAIGKHVG